MAISIIQQILQNLKSMDFLENSKIESNSSKTQEQYSNSDNSQQDQDDRKEDGHKDIDLDFQEDFRFEKKQKKYQEMTFLMGCLKNHFIFYNLSETELENVAKKMFYCHVPADSYLFNQGEKASCFFIIQKGSMQAISGGKLKKQLRISDGFGEIALLYKSPRNFSVKATENCFLWGIDRNTFRKAVQEVIIQQYEQNKKFMEHIRFFSCLSNQHKDTIASALITQNYSKGHVIVAQGDPGSSFYVIKQGTASVWKGNKFIMKLQRTDCFGQQALFYNTVRQMTVKADQDITCLILSRQTLAKVLGDQIFIVTFRNFMKWAIEKSTHLSKLKKDQIDKILDLMKISSYKAGSVVIKKNSENFSNHKIVIVIEGAIKKAKNINPLATRSQIYGEDYLIQTKNKNRYEDDIIMQCDGVLAQIKIQVVKEIIGGYLDVIIENNQKKITQKVNEEMSKRNKNIQNLNQLVVLKQLKENDFGPVLVVGCTNENQKQKLYVLKCYSKIKVQEQSLFKFLAQQKNLFKTLYHPFIMEFYKTFKDQNFLYSLVEFVQGEQLYSAIRTMGLLGTKDAQFYIASMILIIEYLCSQCIIIRDLKPQNFIVDMEGYLKLIDLVSAKVIKGKNIFTTKTFTLIGTPHYMAPQVITAKGYTYSVALYSLGVNLYEFMCGYVPFGQKSDDPLQIYQQVINAEVKYPKSLKDKKAKKLMDQLLNKTQPQSRMGGPTFNSLKNNPWFENIDWDELYNQNLQAPQFERQLNVEGSQEQLIYQMKMAKSCVQYLDDKLPLRNVGEGKIFPNW